MHADLIKTHYYTRPYDTLLLAMRAVGYRRLGVTLNQMGASRHTTYEALRGNVCGSQEVGGEGGGGGVTLSLCGLCSSASPAFELFQEMRPCDILQTRPEERKLRNECC